MNVKIVLSAAVICLGLSACSPESSDGNTSHFPSDSATSDTLGGRDSGTDDTVTEADEAPKQFIQGEFSIPKAMEVVYGLYDKNIECSRWVCKPHEEKTFAAKLSGDGALYSRASGVHEIKEGEDRRMLLLTETLARGKEGWESCHACAPIVGAAMFMEVEGDWYIEALRKDLDEIGSWGEMPPSKLVQIGPQAWGARLDYGSTNQGITEGGMELIGIAKDRFEVLADLETNFSNEGMFFEGAEADGAYAFDSEISFEPSDNPEYWDLIVTTTGRKPIEESGEIEEFKKVRRFILQGTSYQEAGALN